MRPRLRLALVALSVLLSVGSVYRAATDGAAGAVGGRARGGEDYADLFESQAAAVGPGKYLVVAKSADSGTTRLRRR